ncbi:MAG: hypothetical protein K0S86_5292 [Geminicoccaceae bacterium]|nr:hypothetical protein [Geminicoccaceae bacterium]
MSSSRTGTVTSLNRSLGGVPKRPVAEARITRGGMEGDRQRNLKYHGGPDRALCLYSADLLTALRREGHSAEPGTLGENVTITGLDWRLLRPGAHLRIGPIGVEVTSFTMPCRNIAPVFADRRSGRVSELKHPGWSRVYARVLDAGVVRIGDPVVLL